MSTVFWLQDNAIVFLRLKSLKEQLFFTVWVMFWNISRVYIFLAYKTLTTIVTLFFSIFFQSSFSDGKSLSFQLYLLIKGLFFVILCGSLFISSWFNRTVTKTFVIVLNDRIYCHLFIFCPIKRSIMIHHNLDLFCDIYNTITENNRRQTRYLSSIVNYFDIYV